jgi:hypothetical protein
MANKGRRIGTAAGFLSGVITCLDAMREAKVSWPPEAIWQVLRRPQRLELCGGIALIVVTLVMSIVAARRDQQSA